MLGNTAISSSKCQFSLKITKSQSQKAKIGFGVIDRRLSNQKILFPHTSPNFIFYFGVGSLHVGERGEIEDELDGFKEGDTLWAISAKHLGNGARYEEIFEANRPMLSHPDRIYPGQMLRIPA